MSISTDLHADTDPTYVELSNSSPNHGPSSSPDSDYGSVSHTQIGKVSNQCQFELALTPILSSIGLNLARRPNLNTNPKIRQACPQLGLQRRPQPNADPSPLEGACAGDGNAVFVDPSWSSTSHETPLSRHNAAPTNSQPNKDKVGDKREEALTQDSMDMDQAALAEEARHTTLDHDP